jgi:hypothetical protein
MRDTVLNNFNFRDRLEYSIRSPWYHTKLALGIEPKSDKNFMCHDFAVKLMRGILPNNARFTIAGRGDGVGMQGMARLSGLVFANIFGCCYVDTPFAQVDHITNRPHGSTDAWEKLFNLGRGEICISACQDPIIEYSEFLAGREKWNSNAILRLPQCFWLYRRHPELLDQAAHLFQKKYDWPDEILNSTVSVAIHIRRGDVGKDKNSMRYTENSIVMRAISGVEQTLKRLNLDYQVTVHSQGESKHFSEFADRGYHLNLEEDAIIAMRHLIESDVLLMSKSSFSYLAAIYNKGVKLYYPTFNPCLPSWIRMKTSGLFDQSRLATRIKNHYIREMV